MPEFFLELFSEEIPARMQARAAQDLLRLVAEALAPLSPTGARGFFGPRRIAMVAEIAGRVAAATSSERGPRLAAPEQALAGFLRKHGASRDQLRQEGNFWVLDKVSEAVSPAELIAAAMPGLLRRFPWPKSMRWGGTSAFTWVRPLRRIVCIVDSQVVPFDLRDGDDDGHGLVASDRTEGHRFHAPGSVAVTSCADWQEKLRERRVLVDAEERKRVIAEAVAGLAAERGATVVDDSGLLDEVAGLVEWPVAMIGRIDAAFMDLPAEVMQVSMRVNQRYFALRNTDGSAAPYFAFAANIEATDGGIAIIAGNERVLRARFADARHFWDLDRKTPLASLVPKLEQVTFHAKLGSQGKRVRRLMVVASSIARLIETDWVQANRAAELCKADLLTGMVAEFPELQGVMGGYYARQDNEPPSVADAIRDHYAPKGPADAVPAALVTIAVALADKLDQLAGFFAVNEKPTGSGDPYALRRAALGLIRLIRENGLRIGLNDVIEKAMRCLSDTGILDANAWRREYTFKKYCQLPIKDSLLEFQPNVRYQLDPDVVEILSRTDNKPSKVPNVADEVFEFIIDRLRVQLRAEGARHDVLAAVFAAGADDDLIRLLARTEAVTALLDTDDGANLLAAYRRAANILRIEEKKDGPHDAPPDAALLTDPAEIAVAEMLDGVAPKINECLAEEDYTSAMTAMADLRAPLDAFFEMVTVNDPEPKIRLNRLQLLSRVRATINRVADFSKIEG